MCGEASGGCIPTVALVAILFGEGVLSHAVFVMARDQAAFCVHSSRLPPSAV